MKNLLLAFLLFTFSCSTPSDKALTLEGSKEIAMDSVEAYLKRGMNDPSSYEPVKTEFISYSLQDSLRQKVYIMEEKAQLSYQVPKDSLPAHKAKIDKLKGQIDQLDSTGNQVFSYSMIHSFRGKNAFGALILNHYEFTLDKDFNITEAKPLTD